MKPPSPRSLSLPVAAATSPTAFCPHVPAVLQTCAERAEARKDKAVERLDRTLEAAREWRAR